LGQRRLFPSPSIPQILTVDPEAAVVEIDLRHNIDNLPLGINLTESTTTASCRNGVLKALGPDVPRCAGAYRRIRLLLREGVVVQTLEVEPSRRRNSPPIKQRGPHSKSQVRFCF
jgi:N-methylhydantoinase B/oxoprolinase/acetone carboxylase alpha subunit